MLIDSILRKIDIPKIYLRKNNKGKFKYEIIDGQQRIKTFLEFLNNKIPLGDEAEELLIDGKLYQVSERYYKDLEHEVVTERIHKYNLNVVIIENATEDEIADLFYRLNNGTPLSPAEVRNAMSGQMKEIVKKISEHDLFKKVSFSNRRFAYDQVAAQLMLLNLSDGYADTRDNFLSKMYSDYQKSIPKEKINHMSLVLDTLNEIISTKSRLLKRAHIVNLFLIVSYLIKNTKFSKKSYQQFWDWYLRTEPIREQNNYYKLNMISSANAKDRIETRFKIILLDLYNEFKKLAIIELDPKRAFDDNEKILIYSQYNGKCNKCGKKVDERNWHADHVTPWIKGGKTILSNAQLLCIKCNLKKKDKIW